MHAQNGAVPPPEQATAAGGVIRGTVVDARTNLPLQNVMIRLLETRSSTITDSQGRFEFTALRAALIRIPRTSRTDS